MFSETQSNQPRLGYNHDGPFDHGYLPAGDIHQLYYEQYGNPNGKPVIFLHGGPGGQTSKSNTEYFNPSVYRVVLLDQRGAGKSLPSAELRENTSQLLVDDIEMLRRHLCVLQWALVFGGSWGSALALLYTQTYPKAVGGLILRGISTVRTSERAWNRGSVGACRIYPDAYEEYVGHLPESDRHNPIQGYYKLLTSNNPQVRLAAARSWNKWDMTIGSLEPEPASFAKIDNDEWSLTHATLEAHYFAHGAWLEEGQLLNPQNLEKMKDIPMTIIQGRYDLICAPQTAWDLHKSCPWSEIFFISGAGHAATEPGSHNKLVETCDKYASSQV